MRWFSGSARALSALFAISAVVLAVAAACSDTGRPEVSHGSGGQSGAGGSAGTGGSEDGGPDDSSTSDAADAYASDAPLSPVRVGIVPVPKPSDAGAGDLLAAELEVLAAGSRGVSLVRRWDQLFDGSIQPNANAWSDLANTAKLVQNTGRGVLLCLAIVDHTLDARPNGVSGAWGAATTRAALDAAIDKVFASFGEELVALSFGNDVDRWLALAPAADRADMLGLLDHAVSYARTHPSRPPACAVGVTLTLDAITQGKPAEASALAALGDVVVASYYPLDPQFKARPASAVAGDLDLLLGTLGSDAGEAGTPKPVLLQEVGYPSASECQSSPEQQRTFFVNLFQAVATRRDHFPYVDVNGLYDRAPQDCASGAAALGTSNATAEAALCSLGLRAADGTPKPAYDSVLAGLATFAAP